MARLLLYALLLGLTCSGSGACGSDGGCVPDFGGDGYGCSLGNYDDDAGFGDAGSGTGGALPSRCERLSASRSASPPAELSLTVETPPPREWENGVHRDTYDGELRVGDTRAGALELIFGNRIALWRGVHPALAKGTTLWATFDQQTALPGPFASPSTQRNHLRASAQGRFLVDDQVVDFPSAGELSFLGVWVSVAPLCTIETSCRHESYYLITIHADTDLNLVAGERGRVAIGGATYEVAAVEAAWIDYAYRSCAPPDWFRTSPIHLVGYAVVSPITPPVSDAGANGAEDAGNDSDAGHDTDAGRDRHDH